MEKDKLCKFSRPWFLKIKGEWEKNLKDVPEFDISKLKTYLTESCNKTFDKEGMRAYKSLKAFKYFEEGYVQKISSLVSENNYLIRADVMASMAQKVYKPYMCLSSSGVVKGGSCDCVAGKGEACSRIAALLFAIDDLVSKGLKELPADQTGTEKLCTRNRPARRKIEPKQIHDIRIVKQEHGKSPKERETLASLNFDPRHPADRHLNQRALKKLRDALTTANPSCGFMKYHKIILTDKIEPESLDPLHTVRNFNDFTLPPSIKEIKEACLYFKSTLKLDQNGINELEFSTRSQSNSSAWHSASKFRITASTFHKIGFRRKKTDPTCLLKC